MRKALGSGDLFGAQNAFAIWQKDTQNVEQNTTNGPVSQYLQTLQSTLQSGDLSSAQTAFAPLQQDMASVHKAHHHRHHHQTDDAGQTLNTASTNSTAQSNDTTLNVLA